MTGLMINTAARRVIIDPEATVLDMLLRVQAEQLEISKHEYVSLAELQSEGIPVAGMFHTILNFRNRGWNDDIKGSESSRDGIFSKFRDGSRDGYVIYY